MGKRKSREKSKSRSPKIWWLIGVYIILFVLLIVAIVLLETIGTNWGGATVLKIIFSNLASIFGIGAVWEIYGKKNLLKDFSDELKRAENINKSGFINYFNSFADINWEKELKGMKDLCAVFIFGRDWARKVRKVLPSMESVIILPNYNDEGVVLSIKKKFRLRKSNEEITRELESCVGNFLSLNAEVKLYDNIPSFSYYRTANMMIVSPYFNEPTSKGINVPAFQLLKPMKNEDNFFDECADDLNEIIKVSHAMTQEQKDRALKVHAEDISENLN